MAQQIENSHSPNSRFENLVDKRGIELGYLIAAYGIVIGSLTVYALRIHGQRRKLMGRGEQDPSDTRRV